MKILWRLLFAIALVILVVQGSKGLWLGQVTKQFATYSLVESLSVRPFAFFETRLTPCEKNKVWVEEPPLYHQLAAFVEMAFPGKTWIFPLIVFLLFSVGVFFWARSELNFIPYFGIPLVLSPVFLRYGFQQIPDFLALTLMIWGFYCLDQKKVKTSFLLFVLSVTTKALFFVPIFFYAGFVFLRKKSKKGILLFALPLPFIFWVLLIHVYHLPSPFEWNSMVENRHSGSLDLLFSLSYWLRFLTWNGSKGIGVLFFIFGMIELISRVRKNQWSPTVIWALGVFPYWIVVRQGNFVHDYYSLGFLVPFGVLAISAIQSLFSKKWVREGIFLIHTGIALLSLSEMKPVSEWKQGVRPQFCDLDPRMISE